MNCTLVTLPLTSAKSLRISIKVCRRFGIYIPIRLQTLMYAHTMEMYFRIFKRNATKIAFDTLLGNVMKSHLTHMQNSTCIKSYPWVFRGITLGIL